ncbi:DUF4442 domain-containing protein [Jiulongibacter sp. NS-SX5]|uniref:DUF4442 domain-containing protein n=1 Tax=Jiulongibacter sp. NS-SX5 TaxID=3463854 RepID=UPI00405991A5
MSIYQKMGKVGSRFFSKATLFKVGFNLSPMYRRSTGRIIEVSDDLLFIKVKLPLSWKNRNYVNSIFGGSMFSAVDPIPMVQLINLIGEEFVVWDKSAQIRFRKPGKQDLFAEFRYTKEELEEITSRARKENEIEIIKTTELTDITGTSVHCVVEKTIYIARKDFYKEKLKKRALAKTQKETME